MKPFPCSIGGSVLRGRRRLRLLLLGPAALLLAVALLAWLDGRLGPGLLALGVAFVPWWAWRMSGDVEVLCLELDAHRLRVQMRRRFEDISLHTPVARRLSAAERSHLQSLATTGGVVAGSGSFDSHLLGELDLYASNLENAVLVEAGEDRRVVVTPDEPEAFLAALRSRVTSKEPAPIS